MISRLALAEWSIRGSEEASWATEQAGTHQASPNSYRINEMPLFDDPRLVSAQFVDAQRPYVMVNKPEEYTDKVERKAAGTKAPKLSWKAVYEGKQKRRATAAAKPVKEMNAFWAKHPLVLPATNTDRAQHFACATRIFHNGSLDQRW